MRSISLVAACCSRASARLRRNASTDCCRLGWDWFAVTRRGLAFVFLEPFLMEGAITQETYGNPLPRNRRCNSIGLCCGAWLAVELTFTLGDGRRQGKKIRLVLAETQGCGKELGRIPKKLEARNPKFETNSNDQKIQSSKQ